MNYSQLIDTVNGVNTGTECSEAVKKLLSPRPLERPEELETIISTRFRYTGPGKWVKILREAAEK